MKIFDATQRVLNCCAALDRDITHLYGNGKRLVHALPVVPAYTVGLLECGLKDLETARAESQAKIEEARDLIKNALRRNAILRESSEVRAGYAAIDKFLREALAALGD